MRYTDPSGLIEQGEATEAHQIVDRLFGFYRVSIKEDWGPYTLNLIASPHTPAMTRDCWNPGMWHLRQLKLVEDAVKTMAGTMGSAAKFQSAMKGVVNINRVNTDVFRSMAPPPPFLNGWWGDVVLTDGTFPGNNEPYTTYTVIHELAHVWDHRSNHQLSLGMMVALKTWFFDLGSVSFIWDPYANSELPAGANPNCSVDQYKRKTKGCENEPYAFTYGSGSVVEGPGWEDWAESFASYVYPRYHGTTATNLQRNGMRENYVQVQINRIP